MKTKKALLITLVTFCLNIVACGDATDSETDQVFFRTGGPSYKGHDGYGRDLPPRLKSLANNLCTSINQTGDEYCFGKVFEIAKRRGADPATVTLAFCEDEAYWGYEQANCLKAGLLFISNQDRGHHYRSKPRNGYGYRPF